MKTTLILATLVFALTSGAQAQSQNQNQNQNQNLSKGVCQFSSVGWVKAFGKSRIEFTRIVSGGSQEELAVTCHIIASAFVDAHPEQGDVGFISVKVLPNKTLTDSASNTKKMSSRVVL